MSVGTLHELLPWAIALGVTEAWVGGFAGRVVPPTDWYAAPRPVASAELGAEMNRVRGVARRIWPRHARRDRTALRHDR
jgi:hypothetical protein